MWIVAQVDGYYDWVPVPKDVKVTPADVAAHRVQMAADGSYKMRVSRQAKSHVTISASEEEVISKMIATYCDPRTRGKVISRKEAVEQVVLHHLPLNCHRRHLQSFELHDDGPDETLFQKMMGPHHSADHGSGDGKNVPAEEYDELKAAYLEKADHVAHLHARFRLPAPAGGAS